MKKSNSIPTQSYSSLLVVIFLLFATSCNLLEVENPNSLTVDDVTSPSSALSLKNGQLSALMTGVAWTYAATSTISDEIYWTGSYESYKIFDEGRISFDANEILIGGYPEISQARYMSDFTIDQLEGFDSNGELSDLSILTKAHIYSALTRITIADAYDDFVFSSGTESAPAIGEAQMSTLYDQAISSLSTALSLAQQLNNVELQAQAVGLRARAKHAKAVWQKLNPKGSIPSNPLISQSGATADALAAIELMSQDYKAIFDYNSPKFTNYLASQVNSRGELTITEPFDDIITGEVDPRAKAIYDDFYNTSLYGENYSPLTWLSIREMHLIVAEEAVGSSNSIAVDHINTVRALDNLPPITDEQDLVEVIEHERRANLFLQGRRLADLYRFGTNADKWLQSEEAIQTPGTFLPIPRTERQANTNL
jgi:hypothetical protein